MTVWLVLGYVLISPMLGLLIGAAIRMQGAESSCDRPGRATAPHEVAAGAGTKGPTGLRLGVAAGR